VSGLEEERWGVVVEGEEKVWFAFVLLSPGPRIELAGHVLTKFL
jgi:hypothetical protein